jgi:hypothetical protein
LFRAPLQESSTDTGTDHSSGSGGTRDTALMLLLGS